MSRVEIKIVDNEISKRLNELHAALNNPRKVIFDVVAQALHQHTMQTFNNEGDPAHSWTPLKKSTIRDRKSKGYNAAPILQRSERLKRSVLASSGVNYAELSINEPQAAAMHYGAKIQRQGFIRLRTKNKNGDLKRQDGHPNLAVFAKNSHKKAVTRAVNYVINIPARPILPIDENQQLTPSAKTAIFDAINKSLFKTP